MRLRHTLVPLSLTLTLCAGQSAYALDPNDFAAKFLGMYSESGIHITYDVKAVGGDGVELTNIAVTTPETDEPFVLPGTLSVSGISEDGNGGYNASNAEFDGLTYADEEGTITLGHLSMSGIYFPAKVSYESVDTFPIIENVSAGPLTVEVKGKQAVAVEAMTFNSTLDRSTGISQSTYSMTGIHADLSTIEDPEAIGALTAFGLLSVDATASGGFKWETNGGQLAITDNNLTIANVGKLNFNMNVVGYTLPLIANLVATQKQIATLEKDARDAAMMGVGMQVMAQIGLAGVSIRFDDDSISNKVIDMFAAQQGMDRPTFVAAMSAMAPMALAEMGVPELAKQLSKAVGDYLADPKNIEVIVKPAAPVTAMAVMPLADNPPAIVSLLGVTISANQP